MLCGHFMFFFPVWCYHEQHIRAASCRSRLESQWETPQLWPPSGANTIGGIELKIGGRINYLEGLTKRVKFHICKPSGVVWAMEWNIHYLGDTFSYQLSSPRAQVARRSKSLHQVIQNTCFYARKCLLGDLVDTWPFERILGAALQFRGPR